MTAITPSASRPFVSPYQRAPSECIESCGSGAPCDQAACPLPEPATTTQPPEFYVVAGMAIVIADSTCRSDIECEAVLVVAGGQEWYDTDAPALAYAASTAEESRHWIDRALKYFQLRGDQGTGFRVVRNAAFPHLVRFETIRSEAAAHE